MRSVRGRETAQAVTRHLIDRFVDHPPVARVTRKGTAVRIEEVDLLSATPARLSALRAQMMHIQRGSYCKAEHGAIENVDLDGRLRGHVADSTNIDKYSLYNTAIVLGDPEAPFGIGHGHAHLVDVGGQSVEVIRASINILPAARGLHLSSVAYARLMRSYAQDYAIPARPRFYAGFCMSPVMYAFMHHRTRQIVPGPGRPPDALTQAVYATLFGDRVDANGVLPEHAGSRDSERTRAWIDANLDDPAVAFYLRRNPNYRAGFTLPVVVPVGVVDFAYSVAMGLRLALPRRLPFGRR